MSDYPTWSDNPYVTLDTRTKRERDHATQLMWDLRRKPKPWQPPAEPPPNEDPWAEDPPSDPFEESDRLHHYPKGQNV